MDGSEFNPLLIKQLKLISGQTIVGYAREYVPEMASVLFDAPMLMEKFMDGEGNIQMTLYPYMEMASPVCTVLIPFDKIVTAHSLSAEYIDFYLTRLRAFIGPSQFSLEEWTPSEELAN